MLLTLVDKTVNLIDTVAEYTRMACSAWIMSRGLEEAYPDVIVPPRGEAK